MPEPVTVEETVINAPITIEQIVIEAPIDLTPIVVNGPVATPVTEVAAPITIPVTVIEGPVTIGGAVVQSEAEVYRAAVAIGGHRAVGLDASGELIYADNLLGIKAVGMVQDAVEAGGLVRMYGGGRVLGFTGLVPPLVYWLGTEGLITALAPDTGLLQYIGMAASNSILLTEIGEPVSQ